MIRSFFSVGGLTLVSRVLGFVRDLLMARFLGAGMAADAFVIAFKLPNLFRRLFAEGAFSAAFVPLFADRLGLNPGDAERRDARAFAEQALAVLLPALIVLTALAEMFTPAIIWLLTGGFRDDDPAKTALAVELTRLTFPYLLSISLVALFGGVLNGLGRYAAFAAAPILLNLVLVTALIWRHDDTVTTARALAAGLSIAGVVQLLFIAIAAHRAGFGLRLRVPRLSPPVRRLLANMGPVALGAGVMQINLLVDVVLASRFLGEGALSFLYYADRLNQLPLGVIGIAVGTVLLPSITRALSDGDEALGLDRLNRGLEFALVLTVPAALALALAPDAWLRPIYQHGAFTPADTAATAAALTAYAVGLPAYVLVKVLTPACYARQDTRTPVAVSMAAVAVNVTLNLALIGPLAHAGLALATAIAAWANALVLLAILVRRGHYRPDARLARTLPRLALAAAAMGAAVYALAAWIGAPEAKLDQALAAALLVAAGLGLYGVGLLATGAVRPGELRALLRRRG
ncbi:murein biosynthesis integral membrane protein MurJ [Rhodothalassium salexigens]|uniref:murein biosynthesis integral membrane protein MurJ n=1 Tax=Rhodothalassium salexigens TaxID=1086 RepID=UPI0019124564|nr:murein biosynthesis integral membrane protein MurJ [Rhodothalassium salexigens]MBK5921841.1 murein biosynthesis integral membrane protein MurJ [Rhodothalassium salexigens]